MSDDLDFDMEVVEDDELDELGADGAPSSERPSRSGMGGQDTESVVGSDIETEAADSNEAPPTASKKDKEAKKARSRLSDLPDNWSVNQIREVAEVVGGSTPSTKNEAYWNGDIPWATPTDVTGLRGTTITQTEDTITEEGLDSASTHVLPSYSVLMTSRATIGACAVNTVPMATNQGFQSLVPGETLNTWYLFYRMLREAPYLESLGAGSTFSEVSKRVVEKVDIAIPPLPEQRKIASVLYAVDQAIQKTEAIIEQAQRVKQGLMRKFFREGFVEYSDYVDSHHRNCLHRHPAAWEVLPAGEVMEVSRGSHPRPKSDTSLWGGDIPISYFYDRDRGDQRRITATTDTVTEKGSDSSKRVPEGTLIVSNAGTCGVARIAGIEACIHDHWLILRNYEDRLDTQYLFYYINYNQDFLATLASGSTVDDLNTDDFRLFDIAVPPLEEQRKIAATLDGLHDEILQSESMVDRLKRLKKGLMQDLLTGEVRTADKAIEVLDEVKAHG